MKKILVPCDFSETSDNAVNYAVGLANQFDGELVLLHVTQYPVMNPEVGLTAYTYQDAKQDSLKALDELALKITGMLNKPTTVACFSEMGDVTEETLKYAKTQQADAVVMGIGGYGSKFMKSLIGSNALSVSRQVEVPLFIVPPVAAFRKITCIALACDYEEVIHENALSRAKAISALFGADLHLLHVVPHKSDLALHEGVTDHYLEQRQQGSPYRTFLVNEKNASDGLLNFLKNNLVDLIIIEPRKHSLFHQIFYPSVTSEIAFFSPVPVLTIHA